MNTSVSLCVRLHVGGPRGHTRTLIEWLADSDESRIPELNDLTTLQLTEPATRLFAYTTGSAASMRRQLRQAVHRLQAGEHAILGQALRGVPQSYWLRIAPDLSCTSLMLNPGVPAESAAIGPLANEAQIQELYLRVLGPRTSKDQIEAQHVLSGPLTYELTALADRIDTAFLRWKQPEGIALY